MSRDMSLPISERIERDALMDIFNAAPLDTVRRLGLSSSSIGHGFVGRASALPSSAIVINRALAIGLGAPVGRSDMQQLVSEYREAGIARFFVQIHPHAQPTQVQDWLIEEGLERVRGWQKFVRDASLIPSVTTDLRCRRIDARDGDAFAQIVCDAFDLGEMARDWIARLAGRDHWHIFMSFKGNKPAGTGAMYVDDKSAWFDFGATSPEFRRQGSQSALMAKRIAFAAELGCQTLMTCTGEDVPGDPQHSYRNIRRAGFKESYLRVNFAPPRMIE